MKYFLEFSPYCIKIFSWLAVLFCDVIIFECTYEDATKFSILFEYFIDG